ncbi:MAG: ABC transporter permease, partial [Bacilli bacterium]
ALFYSMDFRSPIHPIALIFALALFVTSLGLVFTFIIPSRNGVMAAVQIFVLGGAALGGLWFPVELFPEFLQKAAQLIPQYWFKQGLVDTLTTTVTWSEIAVPLAVALGGSAVCITLVLTVLFPRYIQRNFT